MTAVSALLAEVRAAGGQLGLEGGKLLIEVPRGALTVAQRERLVENRAEIAALLNEPTGDRYGPDEVVADLKTVFTVDGPASHAAAERLGKARVADGPVGDDLPAWQAWMNRRYVWRRGGGSRGGGPGLGLGGGGGGGGKGPGGGAGRPTTAPGGGRGAGRGGGGGEGGGARPR